MIKRFIISASACLLLSNLIINQSEAQFTNQLASFSSISAEADSHTGSANFGVPIEVPPGRGGIQPAIGLSYNSSSPNGIIGLGWNLELSSIRRVTKHGVPQYDGTDTFILSQNGSAQELVYDAASGRYYSKVEGSFLNIKLISASNSWLVTDKSGTKYYFGQTSSSQEHAQGDTSKTITWFIDRVEDLHGNYMTYTYWGDNLRQKRYPAEIRYTGNSLSGTAPHARIVFNSEATLRSDPMVSYRHSFDQVTRYRIKDIQVFADNQLQRKYVLDYTYSTPTGRSLLTKVTQFGSDGTTALPPMVFEYQSSSEDVTSGYQLITQPVTSTGVGDNSWMHRVDPAFDHGGSDNGRCPPPAMCWGANWVSEEKLSPANGNLLFSGSQDTAHWFYTWVYVGQAKTLMVNYSDNSANLGVYINNNYVHTGTSWPLHSGYNLIELTAYSQNQNFSFSLNYNLAGNVDIMTSTQTQRPTLTADFNADSRTDILRYEESAGKIYVSLSNGSTFQPETEWLSGITGKKLLLGDINADGRVDLGYYTEGAGTINFAASTGTQFAAASLIYSGLTSAQTPFMADMDGDGKSDMVLFYTSGSSHYAKIKMNQGSQFTASSIADVYLGLTPRVPFAGDFNGDGLTDLGSFERPGGAWHIMANAGTYFFLWQNPSGFGANSNIVVADMDFDGATDIGYFDYAAGNVHYKSMPSGPLSAEKIFGINFTPTDSTANITTADFNGDTLSDFAVYKAAGNIEFAYSDAKAPDVLSRVDNGVGGISTMRYDTVANNLNTFMPFPIQVIRSVTIANGLGEEYTSTYIYEGGLWDVDDREFRGFGLVKAIDIDGNYSETVFHQDDLLKGRPQRQSTFNKNGSLFSKTENTWSAPQSIVVGADFIFLKKNKNYVFDGDATSRCTAEEFFYDGSPQYGLLTKAVQWGEVNCSTSADIAGDTRTIETLYVNNTIPWLLGLPREVIVKNNAGAEVRKTRFFYDSSSSNTAAPVKGLLTKKIDWAGATGTSWDTAAANPVSQYTYDAYGNLKSTIDPLNKTTAITYDAGTNIFPMSTTNALNHTVTNEYYGVNGVAQNSGDGFRGFWGQLKSTTDPNDQKGKRVYDVFGRMTLAISPKDSLTYPTVITEYIMSKPISHINVRSRVRHGEVDTLNSYNCYDGLGRHLFNKKYSQTPGTFIITGLTEYDRRGQPTRRYLPTFMANPLDVLAIANPSLPHTTTEYDAMGRVVKTINPDGSFATASYNDWSSSTIDENGHKQESLFDAYGRLIEKREHAGADGRGAPAYPAQAFSLYATTRYQYDGEGNLVKTIDAKNNETTISYDVLGRKTSMDDPDMGVWQYGYDKNGNLASQTDAKNQTITFTYDALNRLTRKTNGGALDVAYTYDNNVMSQNSKGRLSSVEYGAGDEHTMFSYDELGREIASAKMINTTEYAVGRQYDALSRMISVQYPNQDQVFYSYNAAGQVKAVSTDATILPPDDTGDGDDPIFTDPVTIEAPFTHYRFNDTGSGTLVTDYGIGNNAGSANVPVSQLATIGKLNGAFVFDGTSQSVNIDAVQSGIHNDKKLTFAFWIKRGSTPWKYIYSFGATSADAALVLTYGSSTSHLEFGHIGGQSPWLLRATNILSDTQWTHIAIVTDGVGRPKVYRNGIEFATTEPYVSSPDYSVVLKSSFSNGRVGVVSYNNVNVDYFDGTLDDFRIYRRDLSANDIKAIYNNGTGREEGIITYSVEQLSLLEFDKFMSLRGAERRSNLFKIATSPSGTRDDTSILSNPKSYIPAKVLRQAQDGERSRTTGIQVAEAAADSPIDLFIRVIDFITGTTTAEAAEVFETKIYNTNNDIEEYTGGYVTKTSGDLNLGMYKVGTRFEGVIVPPGAQVTSAYVQFKADAKDTTSVSVLVQAENIGNSAAFASGYYQLTNRVKTSASVLWTIPAWNVIGETGPNQRTPNIASVIQQVINRPDWASGNSLLIIFSQSTIDRETESYDSEPANAPLLHIEYTSANQAPVLNPIGNKSVNEGQALAFTVSATDADNNPLTYYKEGAPAAATFNATTGQFGWTPGYNDAGTYQVNFWVSDGIISSASETITITVNNINQAPVVNPIAPITKKEGELVQFEVTASDPNGAVLTFSAQNLPAGAAFNQNSRIFSWTPTLAQAGTYTVTFTASNASSSDAESVVITVENLAPAAPSTLVVEDIVYNANGQITRVEYGNGVVTTHEYDPLMFRLTRILTVNAANVKLQDLSYTYDKAGNILSIVDAVNTADQTFQYDHLNRLTRAVNPGTYGTKNYSYDQIGNITVKDGKSYTYAEGNAGVHAVTTTDNGVERTTFVYDANGNMLTKQVISPSASVLWEYQYDIENRLIKAKKDGTTKADYEYDGDGGRTEKIVDGVSTKFVGALFEKDYQRDTLRIYLGSMQVADVTNGNIKFYHTDHLGGTNVLSDASGVECELIEYEPYGKESRRESDYGTSPEERARNTFTSHYKDEETGLLFMQARYYDPEVGRFITADSVIQDPTNPQTINRYSYTSNNPVNRIDPSGHSWFSKFFKKFGDFFSPLGRAIVTGDWKNFGFQVLNMATMVLAPNPFIFASGALAYTSRATSHIGEGWSNSLSKATGYAAIAAGVIGAGVEIAEQYNSFKNTTGEFYQVNQANPQASKAIAEAEILKQYGENGAKIFVNGINMDISEALKMAANHSADILFYNPTSGAYADLFESTLGALMPTRGGMSSRLGKLLTQMRVDLVGYSQGTIIASNAMAYAGLNGGAVSGSTFVPFGKAVGMGRLAISSRMAGMTVIYGQGETKMFDVIRLVSSEINPFGYLQGAVGLFSGTGFKQHTSY